MKFSLYHGTKNKTYSVHRFVFESIKGVIPESYVVDHIDSSKKNNSIYNLQLLSSKENIQKANNKKVVAIDLETDEEKIYESLTKAAKELKIYVENVCNVCKKKSKYATSKKDRNK